MELSKKDKQEARKIIESGLQREFTNGLTKADNILNAWKANSKSSHDAYHQLFRHIVVFDKHIARRYDRMSGSNYMLIIAGQLLDGVITENDLGNLSEDVQQSIKMIADI
ncbi:MAG: hypothetical protein WCE64_16865 [Bacteroidales bacterium]